MNEQQQFQHHVNIEFGSRKGLPFRFWAGLLLVILGVGFLLNVFHVLPFGEYVGMYWPSALMIIAIIQIATRSASFTGAGILFTIGALLQMEHFGWIDSIWSAFWPIVLIIVGASMLFNLNRKKKVTVFGVDEHRSGNEATGDTIDSTSVFSGNDVRSSSRSFRGGKTSTVFGSTDIDLRNAEISGQQAVLDCNIVFGSTDIRVPPHWHVITSGTPVLGNIDNRTHQDADTNVIGPTLVINTSIAFGSLDVKN